MPNDSPKRPKRKREKLPVGWREWVTIVGHGLPAIKAKVDTGAATSSLHAFDVDVYQQDGVDRVRFNVHPIQRDDETVIACDAAVHEFREVRSSSGHVARRPVIESEIVVARRRFAVELTLANRDAMGFRMLLGREALRGRFVVDSGRSYVGGKPARKPAAKTPKRQDDAG